MIVVESNCCRFQAVDYLLNRKHRHILLAEGCHIKNHVFPRGIRQVIKDFLRLLLFSIRLTTDLSHHRRPTGFCGGSRRDIFSYLRRSRLAKRHPHRSMRSRSCFGSMAGSSRLQR